MEQITCQTPTIQAMLEKGRKPLATEKAILQIDGSKQQHIPISKDEIESIVRPELNIEKWSNFIFPPKRARGLDQPRQKNWTIKLPDQSNVDASLKVVPSTDNHSLISEDYNAYIAIVIIWKKKGCPEKPMKVSYREILRETGIKMSGQNAEKLHNSLDRLYSTKLEWKCSFRTKSVEQVTVKNQRILKEFDYAKLKERRLAKGDQLRFVRSCQIQLDPKIQKNILENVTIPVNWESRKQIHSDTAAAYFGRLAIRLHTQGGIDEQTALNILRDLGMDHLPEYAQYKARRKRFLERTIKKHIDGKALVDSVIQYQVLETADGNDWKGRACLVPNGNSMKRGQVSRKLPFVNGDKTEYLVQLIGEIVGGLEKNRGLYTTFAATYPEGVIHRALHEFKEERTGRSGSLQKFFTIKMHSTAHNMGYDWIKPCTKKCKHRPEHWVKAA